jgi:hypothetical protein
LGWWAGTTPVGQLRFAARIAISSGTIGADIDDLIAHVRAVLDERAANSPIPLPTTQHPVMLDDKPSRKGYSWL